MASRPSPRPEATSDASGKQMLSFHDNVDGPSPVAIPAGEAFVVTPDRYDPGLVEETGRVQVDPEEEPRPLAECLIASADW